MSGKEAMLRRIRVALGHSGEGPMPVPVLNPTLLETLVGVMPQIAVGELLPKFEAELQKVSAVSHRVSSAFELEKVIRGILDSSQASAVVLSRNPLISKLGMAQRLRAWGKSVSGWPSGEETGAAAQAASGSSQAEGNAEFTAAAFSATVGITGVDFALAETGTLVLTSRTEGSQLASLAPPVHVALYRRNQLVASLEEVLERLPVSRDPSQPSPGRSAVFITGTSRTADIEQILIRGVHGPREVYAVLVEDPCLDHV